MAPGWGAAQAASSTQAAQAARKRRSMGTTNDALSEDQPTRPRRIGPAQIAPRSRARHRPAHSPVAPGRPRPYPLPMVTIEHDFDATVVTLVDDGPPPLQEDVTINLFEDCVTVEQYDERRDEVVKITFSLAQLRDLRAALDLPEGMYQAKTR